MRLRLFLQSSSGAQGAYPRIPFNYQYPLSAAIYKILNRADAGYAQFLHELGYITGGKTFKLFTFSDIRTPFVIRGGCLQMTTHEADVLVCFYMPEATETFVRGLFMNQRLDIAGGGNKASFIVQRVELEAPGNYNGGEDAEAIFRPISPLVAGIKNKRDNYSFLSPTDEQFIPVVIDNWVEKLKAVRDTKEADLGSLRAIITANVVLKGMPKSRLVTIKEGTPAETKIKGWIGFELKVKAPPMMLDLALGAGLGLYNSQGMGCVRVNKI